MSAPVTDADGETPGHHLSLVCIVLGLVSKQGLDCFLLGTLASGVGIDSWTNLEFSVNDRGEPCRGGYLQHAL